MSGVWFSNNEQSESMRWLFLQIFGRDCVIEEDWVDKTDSPSSSNIKDESAFKCSFPFLHRAAALSHPGGSVRRLLSSYCSAGQNNSLVRFSKKIYWQPLFFSLAYEISRTCNVKFYHDFLDWRYSCKVKILGQYKIERIMLSSCFTFLAKDWSFLMKENSVGSTALEFYQSTAEV